MTNLERAATAWWKSKRPLGWTDEQHRRWPYVNCPTQPEQALAKAASRIIPRPARKGSK